MNNFKYIPKGRDIAITMDGEILIDSDPKIQALVTLINEKDPEILSYNTRGRIAVEMQEALYDATNKYSIKELARNHAENLLKENPKIKTDNREREKALRNIKSGVLAPYSEIIEKELDMINENFKVNEARFVSERPLNKDRLYFAYSSNNRADLRMGTGGDLIFKLSEKDMSNLYLRTIPNDEYKQELYDAIPDILNKAIAEIPRHINVDKQIEKVMGLLIYRNGDKEELIKNWKTDRTYGSLVYYSDKVDAYLRKEGYDVSERARFRGAKRTRTHESHKNSKNLYETMGKDPAIGNWDISIEYDYNEEKYAFSIGNLVRIYIDANDEEKAHLFLGGSTLFGGADILGEIFMKLYHKHVESYITNIRSYNNVKLIRDFVDYLQKEAKKEGNVSKYFSNFIKDLYVHGYVPVKAYKDEIMAEIGSRGIIMNEANFSVKHTTNTDKMNFNFVPYGGVEFFLTGTNSVLINLDEQEQGKLYMLKAYDKSFEKDILNALPTLFNDVIRDIPNFTNIDKEIERVIKELLARRDEDEIRDWKNRVPYSSLTYYSDRISAEIKRHGYDVSEKSRFREMQKSRFYEKYGHKIKNPRIYEAGGKGKYGRYDVSVVYGYKPGDFSISISGLVDFKLGVDAQEEANLILVNKDTFGEEFNNRLYDFVNSYFKDKLRRVSTGQIIKKYVDYLLKYDGGTNIERNMNIFVKDLYAYTNEPLYLYRDEIKAEIEKRGISLELNESAHLNRESHRGLYQMSVQGNKAIFTLDGYNTYEYNIDSKTSSQLELVKPFYNNKEIISDITDAVGQVIDDIPTFIDIKKEIKNFVSNIIREKGGNKEELDTWKAYLLSSGVAHYYDEIIDEFKRQGYVFESHRFRKPQSHNESSLLGSSTRNKVGKMDIFVNGARETINVHLGGNSAYIHIEYDMGSEDKANIWFILNNKELMLKFENKINDAIAKRFEHFINNISSRYDIGKLMRDRA